MKSITSKTIVFITGAFVSHHCWDDWKLFFEQRGYTTNVTPWPYKDAAAEELRRRHPDEALASLRLPQLIEHYADIITHLPGKPIVIGHSLGGLLTQIMVNRGITDAGIAIHSVPPQGVFPTEFSFFKATWKSLGLLTSLKKTYMMSFKDWQYAFTNGMSLSDQKAAYEKLTIPESKGTLRGGLTSAAKVDWRRKHAPLLILAGSADHCIPPSLNYRNFKAYKNGESFTEYKVREARNHFVLGQSTWKEDAEFVLNWIETH